MSIHPPLLAALRRRLANGCALACLVLPGAGGAAAQTATLEPDGAPTRFAVTLRADGGSLAAYEERAILEVAAVGVLGVPLEVTRSGGPDGRVRASVAEAPAIATLSFDGGRWAAGPDGRLAALAPPDAAAATHVLKYAKTVVRWSAGAVKPVGYPLEIMPVAVQPPRAGSALPVRVLYQGRPLVGARVVTADPAAALVTDEQGVAMVRVQTGRNTVRVEHRVPVSGEPGLAQRHLEFVLLFVLS